MDLATNFQLMELATNFQLMELATNFQLVKLATNFQLTELPIEELFRTQGQLNHNSLVVQNKKTYFNMELFLIGFS